MVETASDGNNCHCIVQRCKQVHPRDAKVELASIRTLHINKAPATMSYTRQLHQRKRAATMSTPGVCWVRTFGSVQCQALMVNKLIEIELFTRPMVGPH